MIGRFLIGFTTGLYSSLTPLYSMCCGLISIVREISPIELAGQFSTFYVVLFRCGFLVAYLAGIGLPSANADIDYNANNYWRFMLAFPLVTALIQTLCLSFIYTNDTPKYLYLNGRNKECEEQLRKIYEQEASIQLVLSKLRALQQGSGAGKSADVSYSDLFGRMYIKALFVVFGTFTPRVM